MWHWTTFQLFQLVVIAQGSSGDPMDVLLDYGPLGIMVVGLATGVFWTWPAVKRIFDILDATTIQRDALLEMYHKEVIPTLTEANRVSSSMVDALSQVSTSLEASGEHMRELSTTTERVLRAVEGIEHWAGRRGSP